MRHTLFPAPVDTHDGLTAEAVRLSAFQPWSGQPTNPMVPSGRRIDRLASPYLKPRTFPSDIFSGADSAQGITSRRRSFTTSLC